MSTETEKFHFSHELNWGHVLQAVVMLVAAVVFISARSSDMALIKQDQVNLRDAITEQKSVQTKLVDTVKSISDNQIKLAIILEERTRK